MKKQRRFTKQFEIEAEINKLKLKIKRKLVDADNYDALAKQYIRDANVAGIPAGDRQFLTEQADDTRKKAAKLRRWVEITNDERIPQLGRTLASFQTRTLIPGDDQAVVLSK